MRVVDDRTGAGPVASLGAGGATLLRPQEQVATARLTAGATNSWPAGWRSAPHEINNDALAANGIVNGTGQPLLREPDARPRHPAGCDLGVLTEVDVQAALLDKRGEMGPHVILGACNPDLAHRALRVDPGIPTLLGQHSSSPPMATAARCGPSLLMAQVTCREDMRPIASEAEQRVTAALAALPQQPTDRANRRSTRA